MKYWDGRLVRFVCCERKQGGGQGGQGANPLRMVIWGVVLEATGDDGLEGTAEESACRCC
ncbi:hypothetical protein AcV5_003458 [Taiwanofungus camphoratus]|nr:hypothetical protein AcV5_003458 [Antrodia cinnamomea]